MALFQPDPSLYSPWSALEKSVSDDKPSIPVASNARRFDELAAQWDSNPIRQALSAAVVKAMVQRLSLQPTMKVMDFGAGTGLVTLGIQPCVGTIVAADVSPKMLEVLASKLSSIGIANVRTRCWDAESGDCPESGFDVIISSMAMHHVSDTGALLKRLHAALKPGGRLAFADLDAEDGSFHPDPPGVYHKGFDRQAITGQLEAAGFADVTLHDAHVIHKPGADGKERGYPVFLVVARRSKP